MVARRLILIGALGLFGSLFLTWSHQFSPAFLVEWGTSDLLRGVPHDPTAWQVYTAMDVVLALLAGALAVIAVRGGATARLAGLAAVAAALAFTLHAVIDPPTNAPLLFNPALNVPNYFPQSPGAGPGETVALVALLLALVGLALPRRAE